MNENLKDLYDNEVIDLFRGNYSIMLGSLIRRGVPKPIAEEIVNDTFAAVRRRWPKIRGGRPLNYAYVIAQNESKKWWHQKQKEDNHLYHGECDAQCERDEINEIINRLTLKQAIADLSPREQEVIQLRFFEQLTVKESAEKLGISEGSIKSYTHTAINRLRKQVDLDCKGNGEEGK
ncbi:RNA polymerase sigma factor [Streptomyces alboflavus]|uniref:RNA polymerase sigma factor n=1 Tax=Streptomyces alboflavus TaxID=67267 RepID=UPI0004C218DA|nr:sigma-70 family RNA polymerase sigma factor [Streptomyces alboflavus]